MARRWLFAAALMLTLGAGPALAQGGAAPGGTGASGATAGGSGAGSSVYGGSAASTAQGATGGSSAAGPGLTGGSPSTGGMTVGVPAGTGPVTGPSAPGAGPGAGAIPAMTPMVQRDSRRGMRSITGLPGRLPCSAEVRDALAGEMWRSPPKDLRDAADFRRTDEQERIQRRRECAMAIVRNIEVIAQSQKGFDDACQQAISEAAKTVRGIRSFWIKNAECIVENDRITLYRVNGKISFEVERNR